MAEHYILVVEDDADDEDLMLRALQRPGLGGAVVVRDGQEALDFLFCAGKHVGRNPSSMPVAVLLDFKLPKLDGAAVLRQVRADARTRYLPVVVLTSSTEEDDIVQCYEAGATSYVNKPVDFSDFDETIALLARYWLGLNRVPEGH